MSGDLEDSGPGIVQRLAALEAAVDRLTHPVVTAEFAPLSEAEVEKFREEFESAVAGWKPQPLQLAPSSLTVLDPDTVRQLLRECVTVVKPGEVLILRAPDGWTPAQVREIHELADRFLAYNAPEIKALVIPPMEIAIVASERALKTP